MSDDSVAIKVENVAKSFKLPLEQQKSLKSTLINFHRRGFEKQEVLKDVNFEVKKGEFFGIVGRNGSGKSTLLKLLSGIYTPDEGAIHVNGKLTPFIELGVGFNPELTGRENVFLNGALLGFSRKEMNAMYDDIVAFAEIERFMDQKLKNYSSGMQVRLAFSIAIRAQTDILILDEVLAVGDAAFQKKCLAVFEDYKRNKKTIILVTHDMGVVERYCDRCIYIKDGDITLEGKPAKIAKQYRLDNDEAYATSLSLEQQKKMENQQKIRALGARWSVKDSTGAKKVEYKSGDILTVNLEWKNPKVQNVGIALLRQSGEYVFGTNTINDGVKIKDNSVSYDLTLTLGEGDYIFYFGFFGAKEADAIDFIDDGPKIVVKPARGKQKWGGITPLEHTWSVKSKS